MNQGEKFVLHADWSAIHDTVYNKPYDIVPKDWVEALFQVDDKPQKIDRFWCSALIGYIYTKCGILQSNTDWSIMRPCVHAISDWPVRN